MDQIPDNSILHIQSDASSTVTTWNKGSKIPAMNQHIIPQLVKLTQKGVKVRSSHLPGVKNTRADYLSRQPDAKNYRLNPKVFQEMCSKHHYWPTLDLFANRKNRQTQDFCSWRMDKASKGNAWDQNWAKQTNWLNPPWDMISRSLRKLQEDRASALCCLPVCKTAHWWYQLQSLMASKPTMLHHQPLYHDPQGRGMPAPRWATLFAVLDGSQGRK
jgi:hypothetical protein